MSTNKAPAVSESKEMKDVEAPVSTSSVRSNAPLMENNTQVIDKNLSQVPLSSTGQPVTPVPESSSALTKEENAKPSSDSPNATKDVEIKEPVFLSVNTSNSMDMDQMMLQLLLLIPILWIWDQMIQVASMSFFALVLQSPCFFF
ncbi:hypothetical protein SLA2020_474920 [Shorea laevis]